MYNNNSLGLNMDICLGSFMFCSAPVVYFGSKYCTYHLGHSINLLVYPTINETLFPATPWQPGVSSDINITQTRAVVASVGDNVTLTCRVASKVSAEFFYILWYRQKTFGDALVIMGYLYGANVNIEAEFAHRLSLGGSAQSQSTARLGGLAAGDGGLTARLGGLAAGDGAVYYCGARHGAAEHPLLCTKTPAATLRLYYARRALCSFERNQGINTLLHFSKKL